MPGIFAVSENGVLLIKRVCEECSQLACSTYGKQLGVLGDVAIYDISAFTHGKMLGDIVDPQNGNQTLALRRARGLRSALPSTRQTRDI